MADAQDVKRRRLSTDDDASTPSAPVASTLAAAPALEPTAPASALEQTRRLAFTHAGKRHELEVAETDLILDLKHLIFSLTQVPPERQKILGLVKGKLPADDLLVASLGLDALAGARKPFSVIGTPAGEELQGQLIDVVDDWDVDAREAGQGQARGASKDARSRRRIVECVQSLSALQFMHEPREGKKLLVLDLDATIMDVSAFSDHSVHPMDFARPHLDAFLTACYPYYDVCIWSATSWRYLESKLLELGMAGHDHDRHQVSFVLDKSVMFHVISSRNGQKHEHRIKALDVIWQKYPRWSAANTIHIDDLSRNGVLNPQSLLKISAYKDWRKNRATDHELRYLARYLVGIAQLPDLRVLDHRSWKTHAGVRDP